jgi:hypothetical protein
MKLHRALLIIAGAALIAAPSAGAGNIDTARNLVNKGNYLMASGHFAEALKTYEEAEKYEPSNAIIKDNIAKVYNNWAIWFTKQKKYREAQEKLVKCMEIAPGYGQARTNLALLKRMALEDGIDLDAPADSDPATVPEGLRKLPDGGELRKSGESAEAHKLPEGAQAPKAAPVVPEQQAGAVLFIGGVKQQTTPEADSYTPGSTPIGATTSPVTDILPSGMPVSGPTFVSPVMGAASTQAPPTVPVATPRDAGPATFTAKPQNPMFPVTPNQYPDDAQHKAAPPPAVPVTIAPAPSAVPIVSFDEQLTAVEMKVYGAKQTNLTVLQRLEKIEKESAGQVRTGTILDRINFLKSSFGL